ncbi:hypothetical protein HY477_03020 [Candidatus Uhrbacteria bacterium]|nr:hypothetical protein [Candidatus Uhrbacteria bacterium]
MADVQQEVKQPRFEVRDIGPGFSSTHTWDEDGNHATDDTICNDARTFDSADPAADRTVNVTRGRLIVICLGGGTVSDEKPSYDLTDVNDPVVLHKGNRYRFVAVGLTQFYCEYGLKEEAEEEPRAEVVTPQWSGSTGDLAGSAARAEDAPRTVPETPAAPARGGLGLPGSDDSADEPGSGAITPGEGGTPL